MSDVLERRAFKDGEAVFREGEQGSSAFVVQEGEIVIVRDVDGKEKELAVIGKGGVFGEMALIDDKPRMATARAKGGATVVTVTKNMFDEKLNKTDPFVRALLRILAETVRRSAG